MADAAPAPIAGAPARAAAAGCARPQRRDPFQACQRASAALDQLLLRLSAGVNTHRRYDALEEEAQRIAAAIVEAFRGPAARPVHPPIAITEDGAWF